MGSILMTEPSSADRKDDFAERMRHARGEDKRGAAGRYATSAGMGLGMRIAVEIVVALGVGAGIGYGLDRWLETAPWLMLAGIVLGAVAGVTNVIRVAQGFDYKTGYRKPEDGEKRKPEDGEKR